MKSVEELVAYARSHALTLEEDMQWRVGDFGGWWTASPPVMEQVIASRAAAGLESADSNPAYPSIAMSPETAGQGRQAQLALTADEGETIREDRATKSVSPPSFS